MTSKRKVSYEQDMALARGRQTARANQRRRVAENQAFAAAQAARDAEQREREARDSARRNGFSVGDRVTGRDYMFNEPRSGVVVDGDLYDGVPVLCDDGQTRTLYRNSLTAA